jgi:hypothetical protein
MMEESEKIILEESAKFQIPDIETICINYMDYINKNK